MEVAMATAVMTPRKAKVQPDRIFFPLMCLTILVTVWLGFSKLITAPGWLRRTCPLQSSICMLR